MAERRRDESAGTGGVTDLLGSSGSLGCSISAHRHGLTAY